MLKNSIPLETKQTKAKVKYHIPDAPPLANDEVRRNANLGPINRHVHGIQHVSRVAQLIPVLFNLFRLFRDPAFEDSTEKDVLATQILSGIHDAMRKNELKDMTDQESALLAYLIMRLDYNFSHEEAKYYAESAANKDSYDHFYELHIPQPDDAEGLIQLLSGLLLELIKRNNLHDKMGKHNFQPCDLQFEDPIEQHMSLLFQRVYQYRYAHDYESHPVNQYHHEDEEIDEEDKPQDAEFNPNIFWKKGPPRPRNRITIALHDADTIDIIRAEDRFLASYLDFYQRILMKYKDKNPELYNKALNALGGILKEHKAVIHAHGDSRQANKLRRKVRLEQAGTYKTMEKILHRPHFKAYPFFYNQGKLKPLAELAKEFDPHVPFDPEKELDEANFTAGFENKKILLRALANSSAERFKDPDAESKSPFFEEKDRPMTLAEYELTLCYSEEGNPCRSTSLGGPPFAAAGYAVVLKTEEDENTLQSIDEIDASTEFGDKPNVNKGATYLTKQERETKIGNLETREKLGGSTCHTGKNGFPAPHNEVLAHLKRFDVVFYSSDPNLANCNNNAYLVHHHEIPYPYHPIAPALQAVYLQKLHEKLPPPHGKKLPIFRISGYTHKHKKKEFNDDQIIKMWEKMCASYIKRQLRSKDEYRLNVARMSLDDLKTLSMYGTFYGNEHAKRSGPADSCYDEALRKRLNEALELKRQELLAEHQKSLLAEIKDPKTSIFDETIFVALFQYPALKDQAEVKEKINAFWSSSEYQQEIKKIKEEEMHFLSYTVVIDSLAKTSLILDEYKKHPDHGFRFYSREIHGIRKYYELALLVDNKTVIQQIRQAVKEIMMAALEEDVTSYIDGIVNTLIGFGCYDELKPLLMKKISDVYFIHQAELKEKKDLYTYRRFVGDLAKLKKVDKDLYPEQLQTLVLKDTIDFQQHFLLKEKELCFGLNQLEEYIYLMNHAPLAFEQQQDFIICLLRNLHETIFDKRDFGRLGPYLNNPEIFELVLQKLHLFSSPAANQNYDSLLKWYCTEHFVLMRDSLPHRHFKPWQQALIDGFKEKQAKDLVVKQLQDLHNFRQEPKIAGEMVSYLYLAQQAKLQESEIIPVVVQWLQKAEMPFSDNAYLKELMAQLKPYLTHKDIFTLLINNVSVRNEKDGVDFAAYQERIETIRAALPDAKFSAQQQGVVLDRLHHAKEEVLKQLDHQANWRDYVKLIQFFKAMDYVDPMLDRRVIQCGEHCAAKESQVPLIDYLQLAQEAKVSFEQQKEVIKKHLSQNAVKWTVQDQGFILYLKERGFLQDSELFNWIAERLCGEVVEEKTIDTVQKKYQDFVKLLDLLQPKAGELTEAQQKVIEQLKIKQAKCYVEQITPLLGHDSGHKFNLKLEINGPEVLPSLMSIYLELAPIALIPMAEQKEQVLLWLKQFSTKTKPQLFQAIYFEHLLFKLWPFLKLNEPLQSDNDLFAALIDCLPYNYARRNNKNSLQYDFYNFYKLIIQLKSYTPQQKFTTEQQAIIDKKITAIKNEIYQKALAENKWQDFAMLIKQLKIFNVPHEDIVALAKTQLQRLTQDFESKECTSRLDSYLEIAGELGLDGDLCKPTIAKYFQNPTRAFDKETNIKLHHWLVKGKYLLNGSPIHAESLRRAREEEPAQAPEGSTSGPSVRERYHEFVRATILKV